MTPYNRKEKYLQLRKSDILTAAEHVFASKGYHKATIRDIAKEAQYGAGTIYLHFKDKDALYLTLLDEKTNSLLSSSQEILGAEKDPEKRLKIFVHAALAFIERNGDFYRIYTSADNDSSAESNYLKSPAIQQLREFLAGLLGEAQKGGVISAEVDARQLAEVFLAILKTLALRWIQEKDDRRANIDDLTVLILRLFLDGAANR